MSEKQDRACVIANDPRKKIAVNTADRESREQIDIPGIIAMKALIDAPDIKQLLLRIHSESPGRDEIAFDIAGRTALRNALISHGTDSPCDVHVDPFLTHTKTDSSWTNHEFCYAKNI